MNDEYGALNGFREEKSLSPDTADIHRVLSEEKKGSWIL